MLRLPPFFSYSDLSRFLVDREELATTSPSQPNGVAEEGHHTKALFPTLFSEPTPTPTHEASSAQPEPPTQSDLPTESEVLTQSLSQTPSTPIDNDNIIASTTQALNPPSLLPVIETAPTTSEKTSHEDKSLQTELSQQPKPQSKRKRRRKKRQKVDEASAEDQAEQVPLQMRTRSKGPQKAKQNLKNSEDVVQTETDHRPTRKRKRTKKKKKKKKRKPKVVPPPPSSPGGSEESEPDECEPEKQELPLQEEPRRTTRPKRSTVIKNYVTELLYQSDFEEESDESEEDVNEDGGGDEDGGGGGEDGGEEGEEIEVIPRRKWRYKVRTEKGGSSVRIPPKTLLMTLTPDSETIPISGWDVSYSPSFKELKDYYAHSSKPKPDEDEQQEEQQQEQQEEQQQEQQEEHVISLSPQAEHDDHEGLELVDDETTESPSDEPLQSESEPAAFEEEATATGGADSSPDLVDSERLADTSEVSQAPEMLIETSSVDDGGDASSDDDEEEDQDDYFPLPSSYSPPSTRSRSVKPKHQSGRQRAYGGMSLRKRPKVKRMMDLDDE